MSLSPMAYADSLRIGTVDFVSPDEIKVLLDIEAPDAVALNAGEPRSFPRINSYLLIPSDQGYLVAQVEWITVERSQYSKRKGMQDFGLVDLPYPLRKMSLNPLGCLFYEGNHGEKECYKFRRGVEAYPTIGDPVLLPTQLQLCAIVESGNNPVKIGTSPLAANADVKIDPDRLFGRHLAVLGNTGSGKSCTVAGLIRWSIEEAKRTQDCNPNVRFIILDPNGEYANVFKDMKEIRVQVFSAEPVGGIEQLQVPLWFWNSAEWSTFTQASIKTQRPTLIQALRSVRNGAADTSIMSSYDTRLFLQTLINSIQDDKRNGNPWKGIGQAKGFRDKLIVWSEGLIQKSSFLQEENNAIESLKGKISDIICSHKGEWPQVFSRQEIDGILDEMRNTYSALGGSNNNILSTNEDIPLPFTDDQIYRSIKINAETLKVSEYVETMLMRIRTILSNNRMKDIVGHNENMSLDGWLSKYIRGNNSVNGVITVIDLSLVPIEIIHIITAVIARMTLEALQRYRKINHGKTLPTVLVMEEAHTFIKRYQDNTEDQNAAAICCQVFEKIAREGRKFGLGLVLSSQRPSELSPTVLSQCNSYLLHRISNDRDQDLVHRLVPDNLRGLLRDMPSLPSRNAILLGWASELPVLVRINELPENQRPKSDDPDFWKVWSGQEKRDVNWKAVADDWQQVSIGEENND